MRPITIFRPYEEEVRAIVPLSRLKTANDRQDYTPLLASIGRGYRSLLTRYTDISVNVTSAVQSPVSSHNSFISSKQNMFLLLWRAEHWNTTWMVVCFRLCFFLNLIEFHIEWVIMNFIFYWKHYFSVYIFLYNFCPIYVLFKLFFRLSYNTVIDLFIYWILLICDHWYAFNWINWCWHLWFLFYV